MEYGEISKIIRNIIPTHPKKGFYEESLHFESDHNPDNIWLDFKRIPKEGSICDGIVTYIEKIELKKRTPYCFYNDELKDSIIDIYNYDCTVFDCDETIIPRNDFIVFPKDGYVYFKTEHRNQLFISFYKYIGKKGITLDMYDRGSISLSNLSKVDHSIDISKSTWKETFKPDIIDSTILGYNISSSVTMIKNSCLIGSYIGTSSNIFNDDCIIGGHCGEYSKIAERNILIGTKCSTNSTVSSDNIIIGSETCINTDLSKNIIIGKLSSIGNKFKNNIILSQDLSLEESYNDTIIIGNSLCSSMKTKNFITDFKYIDQLRYGDHIMYLPESILKPEKYFSSGISLFTNGISLKYIDKTDHEHIILTTNEYEDGSFLYSSGGNISSNRSLKYDNDHICYKGLIIDTLSSSIYIGNDLEPQLISSCIITKDSFIKTSEHHYTNTCFLGYGNCLSTKYMNDVCMIGSLSYPNISNINKSILIGNNNVYALETLQNSIIIGNNVIHGSDSVIIGNDITDLSSEINFVNKIRLRDRTLTIKDKSFDIDYLSTEINSPIITPKIVLCQFRLLRDQNFISMNVIISGKITEILEDTFDKTYNIRYINNECRTSDTTCICDEDGIYTIFTEIPNLTLYGIKKELFCYEGVELM
jgi:hypothetical protein